LFKFQLIIIICFSSDTQVTSYKDLINVEKFDLCNNPEYFLKDNNKNTNIHRLVRQTSTMDTQKDSDGSIKMTYWF
jgi:hypothetical protein